MGRRTSDTVAGAGAPRSLAGMPNRSSRRLSLSARSVPRADMTVRQPYVPRADMTVRQPFAPATASGRAPRRRPLWNRKAGALRIEFLD
eukprot:scaffold10478_cov114-Isochrysis_galbana.AAC.11